MVCHALSYIVYGNVWHIMVYLSQTTMVYHGILLRE